MANALNSAPLSPAASEGGGRKAIGGPNPTLGRAYQTRLVEQFCVAWPSPGALPARALLMTQSALITSIAASEGPHERSEPGEHERLFYRHRTRSPLVRWPGILRKAPHVILLNAPASTSVPVHSRALQRTIGRYARIATRTTSAVHGSSRTGHSPRVSRRSMAPVIVYADPPYDGTSHLCQGGISWEDIQNGGVAARHKARDYGQPATPRIGS